MGPLYFQQVLPMPWGGPIAFAAAAADHLTWAHWFFSRCCQCPRVGPLHWQLLLPMALLGPIIFFESCCCCRWICLGPLFMRLLLLMGSFGPIVSLRGVGHIQGWAHYSCASSCRWLRLGPLCFLQ